LLLAILPVLTVTFAFLQALQLSSFLDPLQ